MLLWINLGTLCGKEKPGKGWPAVVPGASSAAHHLEQGCGKCHSRAGRGDKHCQQQHLGPSMGREILPLENKDH